MDTIGEVTIIGAGPAGISAAIYLQRAGFEPLLLEEGVPGGLLRRASMVENYPGFPQGIDANRLADLFLEHLQAVGGKVTKATVDRLSRRDDGTYVVATSVGEHRTRAVIVATGTRARTISIEGLGAAEGRRAFYDPLELLRSAGPGEKVVVYGGGDAAFDIALWLDRRGYDVAILCRSRARCLPLLRERAERSNVRLVEERSIARAAAGERLRLELEGAEAMETDRLLIACGREPRTELLEPELLGRLGSGDQASMDKLPGLYLAGDVLADGRRQVGIAAGSGLNAAMMAERYLRKVLI